MEELSDSGLMELVGTGDFTAFDELYNRYSGPIRKFLFSLTWDQDTAEDYVPGIAHRKPDAGAYRIVWGYKEPRNP